MVYRFGIFMSTVFLASSNKVTNKVEENGLLQSFGGHAVRKVQNDKIEPEEIVPKRKKNKKNKAEAMNIPEKTGCNLWYDSASWESEDPSTPTASAYAKALAELLDQGMFQALLADIRYVTRTSHLCWPQDDGTYGPLFVRLAWHCSGTYRGNYKERNRKGGCTGGRIRFSPEKDWGDNGNLDKARALLKPIKDKYGDGLSWGDLIILAGTLYMYDTGAPTNEFCFGRIDDATNLKSTMLNSECENGKCTDGPLAPTLIYVNPAGTGDHMDPARSAKEVTTAFKRMGFTRHETAALVGGGHAFGRAHGAKLGCSDKGCTTDEVRTSGFHGAWTTNPTKWDNEYFLSLKNVKFVETSSPAGKPQWIPDPQGNFSGNIFMTTADLAMREEGYRESTEMFADATTGQAELDAAFASAWSKLTENGDGYLRQRRCMLLHYR